MRYIYIILFFTIQSSCIGESSDNCKLQKRYFAEKWDFTVLKTYRSLRGNAKYVIVADNNQKFYFKPIQRVVSIAKVGDRVIKEAYSEFAYLITSDNDSIKSRIFSSSCNEKVENLLLEEGIEVNIESVDDGAGGKPNGPFWKRPSEN